MSRTKPLLCLLLLLGTASTPLTAAPIALSGPEMFTLDNATRALRAADIDADGRRDLVVLNNERARIELLLQLPADAPERIQPADTRRWRPQLSDARFVSRSIPTGNRMYALAVGDLDGDGRTDLAYTGKPDGLTLLFQQADGEWRSDRRFEQLTPSQERDALSIVDLDQDGSNELLMLTAEELLVVRFVEGKPTAPERYPLASGESFAPLPVDLDGDQRLDLLYLAGNNEQALRLRLQRPDGRFGPEQLNRLRTPRSPLRLLAATPEAVELASVQARTGVLEWLRLAHAQADDALQLAPLVHAVPAELTDIALYAIGDLDGDGLADLAAADPAGAQILFFRRLAEGGFAAPVAFPAYAGMVGISAGDSDGDGRAELYLASRNEKVVGRTGLDAKARLPFPVALPTTGTPLAITFIQQGATRHLVAMLKEKKSVHLTTLAQADDGQWRQIAELTLPDERAEPTGLLGVDLDQDGAQELLVLRARRPALLVSHAADGTLSLQESAEGFSKSLLDNLEARNLTLGDVDGDGKAELLLAASGYVRALRVSDGAIEVVEQINAQDPQSRITAALPADLDSDGVPELFLLGERSDRLQLLRRDAQGVLRPDESLPLGQLELLGSRLLQAPDGTPELLYLGRDRFWLVPLHAPARRLLATGHHDAPVEEMHYQTLDVGNLDGAGPPELVLLDNADSRILEVLQQEAGSWHSRLHFTVFESDHDDESTAKEPRELLVSDLTGDGRDDIVLLVHDRVLLYVSVVQ